MDTNLSMVDGGSRIGKGRFARDRLAFLELTLKDDSGQLVIGNREVTKRILDFTGTGSSYLVGSNNQLRGIGIEFECVGGGGVGCIVDDFSFLCAVSNGALTGDGEYLDGIYKLAVLTADFINQRKYAR